jgi:hypothetical protein
MLKKALILVMAVAGLGLITACDGGGYSGGGCVQVGPSGACYDHAQLAYLFVQRAYTDGGVSLNLIKTYTYQDGYIVVQDNYNGSLNAIYIDGWNPGYDTYSYMLTASTFYNLIDNWDGTYTDYWTGITFEKSTPTSKDLMAMSAMKEAIDIKASAKNIQDQFGLSAERSLQVARLAVQVKNTPSASLTDADVDSVTKELVGSSVAQIKSAEIKKATGDSSEMDALIEKAATTNGVSADHMNQIIKDMFGKKN